MLMRFSEELVSIQMHNKLVKYAQEKDSLAGLASARHLPKRYAQ